MKRCKAKTLKGKRCKKFATIDGVCMNHYYVLKEKIKRRIRKNG